MNPGGGSRERGGTDVPIRSPSNNFVQLLNLQTGEPYINIEEKN